MTFFPMTMNELFRSLRDQLYFSAKPFSPRLSAALLKSYACIKSQEGQQVEKKFDDADRNRVML